MRKNETYSAEEILEDRIEAVQRRRELRRFLTECIMAAAVVYLVFHYVAGLAFVSGSSMEPSLKNGELAVFYRLDPEYQTGDIVIIHREENMEYIKRIAAEPGDVVDITEDGKVLVNGKPEEGFPNGGWTSPSGSEISYPYTVPENCYFVLGDNREKSKDSRDFGAVTEDEIVGRICVHLGMAR